jgi:hypothetical protein
MRDASDFFSGARARGADDGAEARRARARSTRLGALNRAKCGNSELPQLSFARRVRAEGTYD